jgi:hypothetical protein
MTSSYFQAPLLIMKELFLKKNYTLVIKLLF